MNSFLPKSFELTDEEEQIARIEQSWADFISAWRTGTSIKRRPKGLTLDCEGAIQIHEILELHRADYEKGDASALLWALAKCCEKNVPLPYWCADGILQKLDRLHETSVSLHALFGLDKSHPVTRKKAEAANRNRQELLLLWARVTELMRLENMPKVRAVERALEEGVYFPYGRSKAVGDFDAFESIQKRHRKARRMRW